ncbi:hypothetical protein V6N13_019962 [Hibiscus sabdariffa]|uniref:Uncharacterized protein n=1 Tax=Hibiscus sabdariffa TaxID=183260 RepID=A0ABR2ESH6_9ROSI
MLSFAARAEVVVPCITKSDQVVNYQAFTNAKGIYIVAETVSRNVAPASSSSPTTAHQVISILSDHSYTNPLISHSYSE